MHTEYNIYICSIINIGANNWEDNYVCGANYICESDIHIVAITIIDPYINKL